MHFVHWRTLLWCNKSNKCMDRKIIFANWRTFSIFSWMVFYFGWINNVIFYNIISSASFTGIVYTTTHLYTYLVRIDNRRYILYCIIFIVYKYFESAWVDLKICVPFERNKTCNRLARLVFMCLSFSFFWHFEENCFSWISLCFVQIMSPQDFTYFSLNLIL